MLEVWVGVAEVGNNLDTVDKGFELEDKGLDEWGK